MESLSSMRTVLTLFWQRASNDTLRSCFPQNCPLFHWGFWRRWKACADFGFYLFSNLKEKLKRRNVFLSLLPRHFFLCSNPWIGLNFACVLLEFCLCTVLVCAVSWILLVHTSYVCRSSADTTHTLATKQPAPFSKEIFTKGDSRVNVFPHIFIFSSVQIVVWGRELSPFEEISLN